MLLELDEELRELIFKEIEEFSISYSVFKKLTSNDLKTEVKHEFYKLYSNYEHILIKRVSRTNIYFDFKIKSYEKDWAMKITNIIDGIIDYKFNNNGTLYGTDHFRITFYLDVGSKKDCSEFFHKIFG
ncbi:hypothetical protein D3C81_1401770 [compost metagenome]